MRVLLIHNILWSHYKAAVFGAFANQFSPPDQLRIVHLAETELMRQSLSTAERSVHRYDHEVLFDGPLEYVSPIRRFFSVAKRISGFRPDLIILPGYSDAGCLLAGMFGKLLGAKLILAIDSTRADHPRTWIREIAKRVVVSQASLAFTYGERSKNYCLDLGFREDQIVTRCQATDNSNLRSVYEAEKAKGPRQDPNCVVFGYIGRLSKEKNVDLLIRAFHRVQRTAASRGIETKLRIVGGGNQVTVLRQLCAADTKPVVDFVGPVPASAIGCELAQIDVLVLPSISEPWGLVVNEALACGVPAIVSSNCGCVDDLISNDGGGIVFESQNCDDLEHAMLDMLNIETRLALAEKGLKRIANFTPEAAASQMYAGIAKLAKSNGPVSGDL